MLDAAGVALVLATLPDFVRQVPRVSRVTLKVMEVLWEAAVLANLGVARVVARAHRVELAVTRVVEMASLRVAQVTRVARVSRERTRVSVTGLERVMIVARVARVSRVAYQVELEVTRVSQVAEVAQVVQGAGVVLGLGLGVQITREEWMQAARASRVEQNHPRKLTNPLEDERCLGKHSLQ